MWIPRRIEHGYDIGVCLEIGRYVKVLSYNVGLAWLVCALEHGRTHVAFIDVDFIKAR